MSKPEETIRRVIAPSSEPTVIAGTDEDADATLIAGANEDIERTVDAKPGAARTRPAPPQVPGQSGNALSIGTRISEFEIIGLVGEGGFGIVYRAFDHSLQRRIALKEYLPSSLAVRRDDMTVRVKCAEPFNVGLRSFVNEARLLARFDHPALVKVFRFWEANGTAYMVMPLYEGVTLKQAIRRRTAPPDEAWLRALLVPLLEALEVVHGASCFHRDIAPDNILLLADDRPVLLDFGAARHVIGDMTHNLTVMLKPGYAPIEQYDESTHLRQGAWTDLYAVGAVVHYCITGKPPPAAVGRTLKDIYRPLSEAAAGRYSARFLAAIDHALAPMPDQRPQTIAAFRDELGIEPSISRPVGSEAPQRGVETEPGKRRWPALAGALFGVVVAAAVGYSLTVDRREPTLQVPTVEPILQRESGEPPKPDLPKPVPEPSTALPESNRLPAASITPPEALPVAPPPAAGSFQQPPPQPRERAEPRKPPVTVASPEKKPGLSQSAERPPASTGLRLSERCAALINRAQLGEPMSAADLEYLKKECR
jgi:serine/threonine protein kinase